MEFDCVVQALDALAADERDHLSDCFERTFGHIPWEWTHQPWPCLARSDSQLVGHLSITRRTVRVGPTPVDVGGIGAVTTHEAWRGRGVAGALLACARQFMRDELRVPFGLLICRPAVAHAYERHAWQPVNASTQFAQPDGTVTYPGLTMILGLAPDRPWPHGDIDLQGLPW